MALVRLCLLVLCVCMALGGLVYAAPAPKKSSTPKAEKAHSGTQVSRKKPHRISLSHPGDPLVGKASWYGQRFHGGKTASGVTYDKWSYTAAHRTLPLGTVVEVATGDDNQRVIVCINNRGPFIAGRVIDLSYAAAQDIGLDRKGVAPVRLTVLSDSDGRATVAGKGFFVRLAESPGRTPHRLGPFQQYADASVLRDVLRPKHPDVRVTLETL